MVVVRLPMRRAFIIVTIGLSLACNELGGLSSLTFVPGEGGMSTSPGGAGGTTTGGAAPGGSAAGGAPAGGTGGDGGTVELPAPLAAWHFEGVGGVAVDATGNGHDGTIQSGPIRGAGRYGGGLLMDGVDDAVVVAADAVFDRVPGRSFTMTAWCARGAAEYGHGELLTVAWGNSAGEHYALEPRNSGSPTLSFWDGVGHIGETAVTMDVNTWVHVASVIDAGTSLTLYLDGDPVATGTVDDSARTALQVRVGSGFAGDGLIGLVDNIRFYEDALTQGQVQEDMIWTGL